MAAAVAEAEAVAEVAAEGEAKAIQTGVIAMTVASRTPGPDPDHAQKRAEDLLRQLYV